MTGSIPNYLTDDTARLLSNECLALPSRSIVFEIGSWIGGSAVKMATCNNIERIYCIDTWLGSVEMESGNPDHIDLYQRFLVNVDYTPNGKIQPVRYDSINGLHSLKERGIQPNLVFLDGNHKYEQAWADIHYLCRHFPGVPIVLDDCVNPTGDVCIAAKQVCEEFGRKYEDHGWAGMIR